MPTGPLSGGATLPADEVDRLARLRELVVLGSEPEPVFDSIARLASEVCGVPIALLSLVDDERQWFKANVGLAGINETPRDVAFCAHAIQRDAVFEIPDATLDPRFAANPLVTGAPDIRFYAGAPLVLSGGERVGTLCVIDRQARQLDETQARMLQSLAAFYAFDLEQPFEKMPQTAQDLILDGSGKEVISDLIHGLSSRAKNRRGTTVSSSSAAAREREGFRPRPHASSARVPDRARRR